MTLRKLGSVLVAFDSSGEPYVCAEPVRYVTLPGSTVQRIAPVRMTVAEYAELRRRRGLPVDLKEAAEALGRNG